MRFIIPSALFAVTFAFFACQSTPPVADTKPAVAPIAAVPAKVAATLTVAVSLKPLVDEVTPGDDAVEKAHNQLGDNTETGDSSNSTYRHSPDGWFSWDLKVDPSLPNKLVVTYAGVDKRSFQILVDGKLHSNKAQVGSTDDFYDQPYDLPLEMTKGKQKITVRFQSINAGYAGGVFGIKTERVLIAATPKAP